MQVVSSRLNQISIKDGGGLSLKKLDKTVSVSSNKTVTTNNVSNTSGIRRETPNNKKTVEIFDFDLSGDIDKINTRESELASNLESFKAENISKHNDVGTTVSSNSNSFWSNVTNLFNDATETVGDFFSDVGANVSNTVSSLWSETKNWWSDVEDWWEDDALPWINNASETIWDINTSVRATIATGVVSLVEGLLQFGEAMVDFVALAGTAVASILFTGGYDIGQAIYGAITGEEWSSATKQMWNNTMGFVSNQYVAGWFDSFYENTSWGSYLKNKSYLFDGVRSVGTGIGYIAGVVALTIATFGAGSVVATGGGVSATAAAAATSSAQMAITATAAGIGKGTQNAWADGAGLGEGLVTGTLTGVWEGIQFYIGGRIGAAGGWGDKIAGKLFGSNAGGFINKIVSSLSRIVLDGIDGGAEGFVQPLLNSIYKDGYYVEDGENTKFVEFTDDMNAWDRLEELFDDNGGWTAVWTEATIGSATSFLGEVFDLGKYFWDNRKANADVKADAKIKKKMQKTFDDYANQANSYAARGEAYCIKIDNFEDIPNDFWNKVNEPSQMFFIKNGKTINLLDAKKLTNINSSNLYDILYDTDFINKYKDEVLDKIIKCQDDVFLSDSAILFSSKISKLATDNPEFYVSLSDENLVRMFYRDIQNTLCLEEITNRINNGSHIFSRYTLSEKNFVLETSDSLTAFSKLSDEMKQKVKEIAREDWNYVPSDIREYDFGNTFFGQCLLGKMISEGQIDERGLNIIRELHNQNPNILKQFNFELLNSDILNKLDADYIKEVGVYGKQSSKIVALSQNEKAFDAFVNIVNNSKADDSLSNFYTKTECSLNYLLKNKDNLNNYSVSDISSDEFVDYIIFNENHNYIEISNRIEMEYSDNYVTDFRKKCDDLFYGAKNIEEMKNAYYQKYFSSTSDDVKSFVAKYGDDISSVIKYDETFDTISVLSLFQLIEETDDINYLKDLYENQDFYMTAEEMLHFDSSLKQLYANTYVDSLSKTSKTIFDKNNATNVEYNGKNIKFIEANSDFSFLVHSNGTGFVSDKITLVDNNYKSDWYNMSNPTTHGLSTSYITASNVGCCPVQDAGVLYGFTNIKSESIAIMAPYDVDSNIANYGFTSGNKQKYLSADNMAGNTFRVYNEVVLDRASVKPDCVIIYDSSTQQQIDNALKAASDWDIPVVRINKTQLAQEQVDKIAGLLNAFNTSGNLDALAECVNLYESNVSGFKLNAYVKEGNIDATSSINNENVAKLFSPDIIESSIVDYLNNNASQVDVDAVVDILENIKYKYEIVNTNGSKMVANTKSGINVDYLIDYAKKRKDNVYE